MAESPNNVELNGEKEREAEPEGPRSFFQLHPKAKLALLLLGLSLAIGGFFAWRHYSTRESTDDAQIDGNIYPISSRINGHVTAVEVENNEFVKKGAVLVQVDPTDYNVALERAEANYATALARAQASQVGVPITSVNSASGISSAQARVEQARAAISAAQEQYQAAESKVKQMQADYARAKSDLARYALLIKKDEISRQQYDHAVQAAQSDSAAVAATQSSASAAEQQVSQARALLSQAQADLRASRTGPQRIRVSRAEAAAAEAARKRR